MRAAASVHVVDTYDAEDLYDEIEWGTGTDKAAAHERAGRAIPEGEHGRVLFLRAAARHWLARDEITHARELLEEVDGGPDEGALSLDALRVSIALKEQDTAAADVLLARLLADFRKDLVSSSTCHYLGESLQLAGEPRKALRWFTLPLSNIDPDEDLDDLEELCVEGRAAVRREMGLPKDRFDLVADELAAPVEE